MCIRDSLDATALIGSRDRIRDRLAAYAEAGVTTLSVSPTGPSMERRRATLAVMADLLQEAGLQ